MSYESWRISFQNSELAARAAYRAACEANDNVNILSRKVERLKAAEAEAAQLKQKLNRIRQVVEDVNTDVN